MHGFFEAHNREDRRQFLTQLLALAGVSSISLGRALAELETDFVWARLRTVTGDWFTDMKNEGMVPSSDLNLLRKVKEQTNLRVEEVETVIDATKEELENHPLLYLSTHQQFTLPSGAEKELASVLRRGGFLLMDDCWGKLAQGFDLSARALVKEMFPLERLQPLPVDHPVFRCCFDIYGPDDPMRRPTIGCMPIKPYLEGITLDGRTPLVFTNNDLGCAWEGHPCTPGGDEQRVLAFKMGINLIFYALAF